MRNTFSRMAHPPKNLQAILWSSDVNQLDIEKNKGYIPGKLYPKKIFHFVKNYLLRLSDKNVDEQDILPPYTDRLDSARKDTFKHVSVLLTGLFLPAARP